jgi:hypothetical protein
MWEGRRDERGNERWGRRDAMGKGMSDGDGFANRRDETQ